MIAEISAKNSLKPLRKNLDVKSDMLKWYEKLIYKNIVKPNQDVFKTFRCQISWAFYLKYFEATQENN